MNKKIFRLFLIYIFIISNSNSAILFAQVDNKIDNLLTELATAKEDTTKLRIYSELSRAYTYVDYKLKRKYSEKYMLISKKLKIDSLEIDGLIDMGIAEALQQNNDSAFYFFRLANDKSKVLDFSNGLGRSAVNLGFIQEQTNNTQVSIDYYKQAIKHFKKSKNKRGIAQCYMNIGGLYYDSDHIDMSYHYFKEANKIFQEVGNQLGIASCLYSFGNVNRMKGNYEASKDFFEKSIVLRDSLNDLNGKALSYWGLSKLYRDKKDYEKALKYCFMSYDISLQLNSKLNASNVSYTLSQIYLDHGDYKNALKYADINLQISKSLNIDKSRLNAYYNKAYVASKMSDYKNASLFYSKFIELNDSIDQKAMTQQLFLTEMSRVMDEKEVLAQDNKEISTRVSEYFKTIVAISIFLIVVIVLSILLIKKNSEKLSVNKVLLEQKEELRSAHDKISDINLQLNEHVEIIESKNEDLRQLNNVKNKFFSIISHDMRGPLANLHMLIELYRDDQLSKEELDELFTNIDHTILETRTFLDNLLEWSKNQLEGLQVNKENFDWYSLVVENILLNEVQIKSKKIKIVNTIEPNTISFADVNMMKVIVRNLLSNSIKFCREGDAITFSVDEQNEYLEFIIKDTGVGISEENSKKLFQLVNSKSVGTSGEIGHQIGLVLCKDMIEINGGTIRVESKLLEGTTFYIRLPKTQA